MYGVTSSLLSILSAERYLKLAVSYTVTQRLAQDMNCPYRTGGKQKSLQGNAELNAR